MDTLSVGSIISNGFTLGLKNLLVSLLIAFYGY